MNSRQIFVFILYIFLSIISFPGNAQSTKLYNWPDRPIKLVVPYPAGSHVDMVARLISDSISRELPQPIVIDNKPGAGGTLGASIVAKSAPDGYTLLFAPIGVMAIAPHMKKQNYSIDDFVPIAKLAQVMSIIAARNDAPFSSFDEFVRMAKDKPNKFTFASNGVGSGAHLMGVIIQKAAGINLLHVPYKGANEQLTDILAGRVDVMYVPIGISQVREGKLKGLATIGDQHIPGLPNVPTIKEVAPYITANLNTWFGLLGPRKMDINIVTFLNDKIKKILGDPELGGRLMSRLFTEVSYENSELFAKTIHNDFDSYGKIIKTEKLGQD